MHNYSNETQPKLCQVLSTRLWLQKHQQLLFPQFLVLGEDLPFRSCYKPSLQAAGANRKHPVTQQADVSTTPLCTRRYSH